MAWDEEKACIGKGKKGKYHTGIEWQVPEIAVKAQRKWIRKGI